MTRNFAKPALLLLLTLLLSVVVVQAAVVGSSFAEICAWAGRVTFVLICLASIKLLSIREYALMLIAAASAWGAWRSTGTTAVIWIALDLAAFFGAFIAALTVMRDVASRSSSVLAVGRYLTGQTAGRRYWATALGGHILGVFLNFGAISLMAPLIQESARGPDGTVDRKVERRQIAALIRGFAWVLLWAPTMLAQAVLLTLFPAVTWAQLAPLGIVSAAGFMVLGRLCDRYEWRGVPVASKQAPLFPRRAFFVVTSICAILIGVTLAGSQREGISVALALMVVAPLVTVLWFHMQSRRADNASLIGVLIPSIDGLARSAIALGLSGFIGRVVGQVMASQHLTVGDAMLDMPGWLFLALLPVVITLAGQIALSPIMMVVLIGELLASFETLPTGEMQILFSLSVGWSLSMMMSPNATATLLISATTRIAPTTLTWRWNLRYGLLCYVVAVGIFASIA